MSSLARGRKNLVMEEIDATFSEYVARHWENLCRESISGNILFGFRWKEASRWWGTVPGNEKGKFQEMEFDVMAESTDGKALLVGECKWTNPEIAYELHRKIKEKVNYIPFAHDKTIITVLFLKNKPKDDTTDIRIIYPKDIIDSMYPDE